MPLPFFAPWMLWGLAAAAIPILLHILRRQTARRIVWGAWMFLAETMRLKRRRLLLEDLLLMLLRTLALVCAALAFARPFLPEFALFGSRDGARDVVLLLDDSASMNLRGPSGRTRFEAAKEEARELVRHAPDETAFGLVAGGRILTSAPFTSKREVLSLIDAAEPGTGVFDAPARLADAAAILAGGTHSRKDAVIFGDGQAWGWRAEDAAAWDRVGRLFARFGGTAAVTERLLEAPARVTNAAIAGVTPSRRMIGTDRPVTFTVAVTASGTEAATPGDVSFSVDGQRLASAPAGQVLPGATRTLPFSVAFTNAGPHTIVASLAQMDDLASDNVVTQQVDVMETMNVLLVNGHPGATGFDRPTAFLEAALAGGVTPRTVRVQDLARSNAFDRVAACFLCDVPNLPEHAAENLAQFVAQGGGLVVVPADGAELSFYTNWTWKGEAVVPHAWTSFTEGHARFDELKLPRTVDVPYRFADGTAACVTAPFGRGRVAIYAEPFDRAWSAFPSTPAFVPRVHELVYDVAGLQSAPAAPELAARAREGDLQPLDDAALASIRAHVPLALARQSSDLLASVSGRGFGTEIWKPFAWLAMFLVLLEIFLAHRFDLRRGIVSKRGWGTACRFALRVLALLAIGWMLLHLVWAHDRTRTTSRRVVVLEDRSLSMARADCTVERERVTRAAVATNVVEDLKVLLSDRYDVSVQSFGGATTDFAAALESVRQQVRAEELAGVVLVTDGRLAGGSDPEPVARRFAHAGQPVATVLVGSTTSAPDAALVDVRAPETVFLGDAVRLSATVRARGLNGKTLSLALCADGTDIATKEEVVDGDTWEKEIRFRDVPTTRGVKKYTVVLKPPQEDTEADNNAWPVDVAVTDDRINVLVLDRRPRWEFRYLRNLFFARDKSIHLQYYLSEPDRVQGEPRDLPPASAARPFGSAEAGALPRDRDAWRAFDVIVLGDLPPSALPESARADIQFCVEERGALLVVSAGTTAMPVAYAHTPFAALLPVSLTNALGQVTAHWTDKSLKPVLTPRGTSHPVTALAETVSANEQQWQRLPAASGYLAGIEARPGAETLIFAEGGTALDAPVVVAAQRGRGKVLFLGMDETWRMRYQVGDTIHHRFWGNVAVWGAGTRLREGNAFARVGTDVLHATPGEKVKVSVRLTGRDSRPVQVDDLVAKIQLPNQRVETVPLLSRPETNGVYEAQFDPGGNQGEFRVEIASPTAEQQMLGDWPAEFVTQFWVEDSFAPCESADPTADAALPAQLARLTNGKVVRPTNELELVELFGAARGTVVEHVENPIWAHPIVFGVFALALSLVWIFRKRRGLA